jgi:hypothetical protein
MIAAAASRRSQGRRQHLRSREEQQSRRRDPQDPLVVPKGSRLDPGHRTAGSGGRSGSVESATGLLLSAACSPIQQWLSAVSHCCSSGSSARRLAGCRRAPVLRGLALARDRRSGLYDRRCHRTHLLISVPCLGKTGVGGAGVDRVVGRKRRTALVEARAAWLVGIAGPRRLASFPVLWIAGSDHGRMSSRSGSVSVGSARRWRGGGVGRAAAMADAAGARRRWRCP